MEDRRNWFWRELEEGQVHLRDRLQFELKSEFITSSSKKASCFTEELYIFVPDSLQIKPETYTQEQFYLDQTNLIRYKTPSFMFEELLDPKNSLSPLYSALVLQKETKLLGNIFRSTLRTSVKKITEDCDGDLKDEVELFCTHIEQTFDRFRVLKSELDRDQELALTEEFMQLNLENYLLGLIEFLRAKGMEKGSPSDNRLCDLLFKEKVRLNVKPTNEEDILSLTSWMNKHFYEALSLKNTRIQVQKKHGAWIGMLAAALAMFVYMILFVWKASTFGINSIPFILFAVIFYVLKDRLKEGMKDFYRQNAYRWFPDYSTKITTPDGKILGTLNESFQYVNEVPEVFNRFKTKDRFFSETIMQYKKEINLTTDEPVELNTIFRFNIHKFLEKAADAIQNRPCLNPSTRDIEFKPLPKVYTLTVLLKNTFAGRSEIKKFHILITKQGIERVLYLGSFYLTHLTDQEQYLA